MPGTEALDVLRSIDSTLKAMLALMQQREVRAKTAVGPTVASDRDLDGKYGDPAVKFNPRDWTGPSMKQRHLSECPPEFLDMLAETFDYFARKADETDERTDKGKKVSDFKRQDAARARGWAKRMREGKVAAPKTNGHDPIAGEWAPEGWA